MSASARGSIEFAPAAVSARWEPAQSYPDPAVDTLDPRFDRIKPPFSAAVERLATGFRWAEGPVWFGDARCLLWSDIPNNRIMRWDEESGAVGIFRKPSNYANGNTRDRQGRLVTCEHGGRRVIRTEYDGAITVILDRFDGKRLNSPNDVVVKSDDSIWFTDPPFGILGNYEGDRAPPELPTNVYRVDGRDRPGDGRGRRYQRAERPVLFARRKQALYRRVARAAAADPRLRRGRGRHQAGQRPGVRRRRRGHAGRVPLRCRRQSMVRLGHERRRSTALSSSPRTGR